MSFWQKDWSSLNFDSCPTEININRVQQEMMLHWGWRTWTRKFPGQGTWFIFAFFTMLLSLYSWQDHHIDVTLMPYYFTRPCIPAAAKSLMRTLWNTSLRNPTWTFLGVAWRQGETCETVARRRTFTADKVRPEQSQCQVAAMLSAQHETSPGKDRKCKHELHWWAVIQNTYCLYCTLSYRNDNTII